MMKELQQVIPQLRPRLEADLLELVSSFEAAGDCASLSIQNKDKLQLGFIEKSLYNSWQTTYALKTRGSCGRASELSDCMKLIHFAAQAISQEAKLSLTETYTLICNSTVKEDDLPF